MMAAKTFRLIRAAALIAAIFAVMLPAMPAHAADPIFPVGSRIGLVPPQGMVPSKNFEGFEDVENNAAILLATFPAEAYAQLDKSMVPQALQKQGIDIESREPFAANAGTGFLLSGKQTTEKGPIRKLMLVAAAGDVTALVNVQLPEQEGAYPDKAVRDALATLVVRASVPDAERLSLMPFTIGDLAGFRIDQILPGRAMMLVDATAQNDPSDKATADKTADASKPDIAARFLIAAGLGGPDEAKDRDEFARVAFDQIGGIKDVQVQDAEPMRINGQAGYETLANAKDPESGGDLKVVQWLRFGSGGYIQMIGVVHASAWLEAFPRMRALRDSIEPK
jgi:hypothetical protein